ncbi:hypothetical protein L7F22_059379 [Adiantum nelumboides]|nr:hypothetical protein [Adiantum nelumboides]
MAEMISLEKSSQSQSLLPTSSRTYCLDKLTGPNYLVWRVRMELLLQRAQLWDVVIGGAENAPPTTDAEGLARWQQKDLAARMEIIVHLGDRQVPDKQWHEFKKPPNEQQYAKPVDEDVDIEPRQEELHSLAAACHRLWELDLNRLTPGLDYEINCGDGKKVYNKEDMAENSLFRKVNRDVFRRPTYARFYALLDNYTAKQGEREHVTAEERQEELAFLEEISRSAPIKYLHEYLAAKRVVSRSREEFKQQLHSLWFGLYGRGGSQGSSSAFEHVFVGEFKSGYGEEVSGFHNWIKFYVEEAAGRIDYQGYILPRRRNCAEPDAHTQCLSIQFTWNGVLKPVSSTFVGVSPEFELALYTLCFYLGEEDNYLELGPYSVNIKCYHLGREKMGSCFPIAED